MLLEKSKSRPSILIAIIKDLLRNIILEEFFSDFSSHVPPFKDVYLDLYIMHSVKQSIWTFEHSFVCGLFEVLAKHKAP